MGNEDRLRKGVTVVDYYNNYIKPHEPTFRLMIDSDKGGNGICPFHDDTDPSFHDWKDKGIFHCFGCGEAGDIIRLHQLTQQKYHSIRIDRDMAMKSLALMYGIELEYDEKGELVEESVFERARKRLDREPLTRNPKSMTDMSVGGFTSFNNQVKRNDRVSLKGKIESYARLDITFIANSIKRGKLE